MKPIKFNLPDSQHNKDLTNGYSYYPIFTAKKNPKTGLYIVESDNILDIPLNGKSDVTRSKRKYEMSEASFLLFLAERGMRPASKPEIEGD
jgi:hypothetical protein